MKYVLVITRSAAAQSSSTLVPSEFLIPKPYPVSIPLNPLEIFLTWPFRPLQTRRISSDETTEVLLRRLENKLSFSDSDNPN